MDDQKCICTGLRQAALSATQFYDAALAPAGIKITMFRLLRRIDRAGTPTITELALAVQLDRSTLGRNLKVLERSGLVRLSGGDDERTKTVSLTPLGKKKFRNATPLWNDAQREIKKRIRASESVVFDLVAKLQELESSNVD